MSPQIVNMPAFAEVLAKQGWADIDEIYMACKDAEVFGSDFYDRAIEKAMKSEIRRMLRSGKVKDEAGNVINVASIIIKDKDGQERRVYKQEMLFDPGDCVQVAHYWRGAKDRCTERLRYYIDLAVRLHGPQIQGLLPLCD